MIITEFLITEIILATYYGARSLFLRVTLISLGYIWRQRKCLLELTER